MVFRQFKKALIIVTEAEKSTLSKYKGGKLVKGR